MTCTDCESGILRFENFNTLRESRSSIMACLHICFRDKFLIWAGGYYFNVPDYLISDSFSEGIEALANFVWKDGLSADAKMETIVFNFCKKNLLKNIKANRNKLNIEFTDNFEGDVSDDNSDRERYFECLRSSMMLLDNNDLEIITWKHYLELSNDDITQRLNSKIRENKKIAEHLKTEITKSIGKESAGSLNEETVKHLEEEIASCLLKKISPQQEISTHAATQRLFNAMERLREFADDCIKKN